MYTSKQALGIWACLSLPSILVTLILFFYPESDDDKESRAAAASDDVSNASYTCYENLTVYHPIYLEVSTIEERIYPLLIFVILSEADIWFSHSPAYRNQLLECIKLKYSTNYVVER